MKPKHIVLAIVAIVCLLILMAVVAIGAAIYLADEGAFSGGGKVALIRVEGVITSGDGGSSLFGEPGAGAEHIIQLLEEFREDDSVRVAVLRINSPGGSAAGSQEVYREIMRLRGPESSKKIVVSMGDVAASGGYYIASAADKIYADPATMTGSIGVIMETSDMTRLLDKLGIGMNAIKSDKHKDMGSFARPLTDEEKGILQGMIDDVFDQFLTDVSRGRKLPKPYIRKLADGRVYTGRQAKKLKLIDETGGLEDALRGAAQMAGIEGEFRVREYEHRPGLLDVLMGEATVGISQRLYRDNVLGEISRKLLRVDTRLVPQ